jgi:hypothetical protein
MIRWSQWGFKKAEVCEEKNVENMAGKQSFYCAAHGDWSAIPSVSTEHDPAASPPPVTVIEA